MKMRPSRPRQHANDFGFGAGFDGQWPVITFLGMMGAFGLVLLGISIQDNLKA